MLTAGGCEAERRCCGQFFQNLSRIITVLHDRRDLTRIITAPGRGLDAECDAKMAEFYSRVLDLLDGAIERGQKLNSSGRAPRASWRKRRSGSLKEVIPAMVDRPPRQLSRTAAPSATSFDLQPARLVRNEKARAEPAPAPASPRGPHRERNLSSNPLSKGDHGRSIHLHHAEPAQDRAAAAQDLEGHLAVVSSPAPRSIVIGQNGAARVAFCASWPASIRSSSARRAGRRHPHRLPTAEPPARSDQERAGNVAIAVKETRPTCSKRFEDLDEARRADVRQRDGRGGRSSPRSKIRSEACNGWDIAPWRSPWTPCAVRRLTPMSACAVRW